MHHHSADCHHHHEHPINAKTKQTQLAIALLLIGGFAAVELVIGLISHSLALVAESGHMASDCLALLLALLASWWVQSSQQSQLAGKHDLETGAALVNGLGLGAIALWIGWEAFHHLQSPPTDIASLPMLLTAGVGVLVNGINVAVLHQGSDHDLNLKAAFLHVLADTISSVGVILAAIAITTLHWFWADGAISLFVAALIFLSAIPLVIDSAKSFLAKGEG